MKENQNIEWKESWRDEYIKWICGFANAVVHKDYSSANPIQISVYEDKIIIWNSGNCLKNSLLKDY